MIDIFDFSTSRNKFKEKNKSVNSIKKELFQESNRCYLCLEKFDFKYMELEHKIPVEVGGHLFKKDNVCLCCVKCHRKKTIIDLAVIRQIKSTKILFYKGHSFLPLKELEKIYLYLFELTKMGYKNYDIWQYGRNGVDYKQNILEDNRI
jgi:hypothetical protein